MKTVHLAWIVLALAVLILIVFMWSVRVKSRYEGFRGTVEAVEAPGDSPSIARVLKVIQRMSATLTSPSFFLDALRKRGMSATELARDYIQSQKVLTTSALAALPT